MSDGKSPSWFYPKRTGDPGRDRNARTLQFACLLFAIAIGIAVALDVISREPIPIPIVSATLGGLCAAAVLNHAGRPTSAGRIVILVLLLCAVLRVVHASDGFRSHAMLMFPGVLLLSVMLIDRSSYVATAGIVMLTVAALGIAEKHALFGAIPPVRTPTNYESIFLVELTLVWFSLVGSRIARDAQRNVSDLDVSISQLSTVNLELRKTAEALRQKEQQLASIYDTVGDVIFQLAVESEGQFRFISVNAAFLRVTGLSREAVVGKAVNEVIPEPSLTMVVGKYRQAIEENTIVCWEETSDYPTGRLTGEVSVTPVIDQTGKCTHLVGSVHDITERKRAETALRESEERFRDMADAAPVMIWVSGPDKLGTFFNKPWLDFRGRTMEQELGRGCVEGIHPDDRDGSLAIYGSAFDSRRPFQKECRLLRADGEYRWVLDHGIPLYHAGEFAGFIGSCIDITDQKLIEEQLRANEIQLMDAQRLTKVGSWEFHIETGISRWSDENRRILGVPDDAPSNLSTFINRVHPKDRNKVLEGARTVISTGETGELQYRIIRPDGEIRVVRSVFEALRNDQGMAVRIVGATQDITDQIKATKFLRESEGRLKNAERLAHLGHWNWDAKSNKAICSEEYCQIYGQPMDYTPSFEDFLNAVIPQDRARVGHVIRDALAQKTGYTIEFQIARPTGEFRTVSSVAELVLDDEGMPAWLSGTCQDITDVRRAQEEFFARQKLESVGTLAGGIAHDFNNLLGAVQAQAELALEELDAGASSKEELKAICETAMRGSEIVRQLMIYAGKESDVVELVDLSKIVAEMLKLLKVSVTKRAVIKANFDPDLPAIRASAAQLRQIAMNLIINASDAIGDRAGVIRVVTRRVPLTRGLAAIPSTTSRDGHYVELEVSDNGCGMSPEIQVQVFDPFFTTKSPGRGLGLAVVHGIVRSLGGAIHLTSEPEKGTRFQVLLPCAEATAVASGHVISSVGAVAVPSQNGAVLVVEDEGQLRQAVVKMLRKSGFEVFEAADGSSAIDLLRADGSRVDVILLDMTIPGASSHEVVAAAANAKPNIRVILTSAYSQETIADAMSPPQIRSFIRKPFQLGDLLKTLRSSLSS
jgi:PAS domain S-box-containing protein